MEHRRNLQHPDMVALQLQPQETKVVKIAVGDFAKQVPPKDRPEPRQVPPKDRPSPTPAQVPPKGRPPTPTGPPPKK